MSKLSERRVSRRAMAWLCVAALLISLLPLYAISFYNHACYDDFGFTIRTHGVWRETGSVLETVKAAVQNTVEMRDTWQGTFATSVLGALQPALFGEGHYWITTALLLSFLLLALGLFLRQTLLKMLGTDKITFWMAFSAVAFVMIQFVPDMSEAFFWFNGGVGYTLVWSVMLLRLTLWFSFDRAKSRGAQLGLYALLALTSVFVGGGNYTTPLFACLADALLLGYAFSKKRPCRWAEATLSLLLLSAFAFSMTAPGNWVRAGTLAGGMSAPKAIAQAFYFGLALMGHWFSLPLMVVCAMVVWQLHAELRASPLCFAHPLWATVISVCLFCAQLTPTLVTGNYIGDGRTLNTYYYTFVLMLCALSLYWTGWFLRRAEQRSALPAISTVKKNGLRIGAALAAAAVLVVGCVSYHPEGAESWGLQYMASGSALRSLLDGSAESFDAAMDERDAVMNDESQQDVIMKPVENIPAAFMGDALDSDMLDYVLSLYQEYYQKHSVTIETKGEEDAAGK